MDTSSNQARPAKKDKKKKKKRPVVQEQDQSTVEAKKIEGQIASLNTLVLNPPSENECKKEIFEAESEPVK